MAETKKTEAAAAAAPPEAACLTLRQKLVEMRKACPEIVKKQHSDGVSYKYAKIYDVWEKITPIISIKVTYKSEGLQKLRKAAGLSQSQLADLAGIKVQVLQQYERGARDINGAKLPTLLKICNALECRLADIITDEETLELLKKYEEH